MSTSQVYTDAPAGDGSDRVWLDSLGEVESLKWAWTYSGGPTTASWNLDFPALADHPAFAAGRRVGIAAGAADVWTGTIAAPERGTPWSFTALGIAAAGKRFRSYAPTSHNANNLDETIDEAHDRGLPWTRVASITTGAQARVENASVAIDEATSGYADRHNDYWYVEPDGTVHMEAAPVAPTHILAAQDVPGGRTLLEFITTVYVRYISSTSKKATWLTLTNADAEARFGVVEDVLDLRNLAPMTSATATSFGQDYLDKQAPRLAFTDSLTITAGELLNIGGAPVDLATLAPPVRMLIVNIEPDTLYGDIPGAENPTLLVGGFTYDDSTGTAEITPVEFRPRDFANTLARQQARGSRPQQQPHRPKHHAVRHPHQERWQPRVVHRRHKPPGRT